MTRVWFNVKVGTALFEKPESCGEEAVVVQVNMVPETFDVSVMPVAVLLHCDFAAGELERLGVGKMVTV